MYNDYYLLKKIEEVEGSVAYASAQDSFTYMGEVVEEPISPTYSDSPKKGDKVIFLRASGEDMPDGLKAIKYEDLIRKI